MSKQNQSILDDLMELADVMPWWLVLLLALGSYLLFHHFAVMDVPHVQGAQDMGALVWRQSIKFMSMFLQYLVPLALILGAVLSVIKQMRRGSIFKKQTSLNTIRDLGWKEFELLISEAYRKQGYQVNETQDGPDGGVDLILHKDGRKIFVQCKHWKSQKVGIMEVRALNGIIAAKGAYSGIFVTSGIFTTEAINFAESCPVELVDGDKLIKLIPQLDHQKPPRLRQESQTPSCPICGKMMKIKTARKGPNVGNQFWGCSTYPNCKGTINID